MVKRVRKDWSLLTRDSGRPLFLTKADYGVVVAEESYRLRWLVNDLLLKLDESGRLGEMRTRWLDEEYAFPGEPRWKGYPSMWRKWRRTISRGPAASGPGHDRRERSTMMRRRAWMILAAAVLLTTLHPSMGLAVERAEAEETARLLAKLLESGRAVIERNQSLIDDPHKGEKGFTPELFEQQVVGEFHAKTGIDLNALPTAPVSLRIPPLARGTSAGVDAGQPGSHTRRAGRHQSAWHRL